MAECIELISDILKAENYEEKTCPFDKEMALNLDRVEIKKKKGRNFNYMYTHFQKNS